MPALGRSQRPACLVLSPDDGVGVAVRVVVRFHVRTFVREEAGARAGEVEPVHQLRVATRRLRAALRLFHPVLPSALVRQAGEDLAWVADAIGAVRDLDVLAAQIATRAPRLDADSRRALGPLGFALQERRIAAHAALVVTLDSARCRRLLGRLTTFADSALPARQERLGDRALDLVLPVLRPVLRAGRRVSADVAPAALHSLRVRIKRLRYALETVEGLGGKASRRCRRRLVRLQELLGMYQDATTGAAWLRQYGERAQAPASTVLAVGGLMQLFLRRARKARRAFPEQWARLDRRRLRAEVTAELTSGRRQLPPAAPAEAS